MCFEVAWCNRLIKYFLRCNSQMTHDRNDFCLTGNGTVIGNKNFKLIFYLILPGKRFVQLDDLCQRAGFFDFILQKFYDFS